MRTPTSRTEAITRRRVRERLAVADRQQQEKADAIDFNDATRYLDHIALADRRGGKRGVLCFWHKIKDYAETQIDTTVGAIRREKGDERRGPS